MTDHRIGISIDSSYTLYLLRSWATRTRQPVSSLARFLLEMGLHEMIKTGRIPEAVKEAADKEFFGVRS